ncbi:hypothetical protein SCHPADRAFT_940857 [Schizopora paradoxa]|uniref:DUF6533 domain-containing protein n=1 Tax=Schizopora paradoxa TaxID=27342 RepID=A0A0H2RMR3_9AGAM|nr:hypothetical protein SCHPADRAFT_940857 [Schizopora paradoxa]
MSGTMGQIELQSYKTFAREGQIFESILFATLSLIITEFFQTIESEIRCIWSSKLSFAKILYFANRYIAPANIANALYTFSLSKRDGPSVHSLTAVLGDAQDNDELEVLSFFQAQVAFAVLCVRVYAVYGFARPVLIILLGLYIISFSANAYLTGVFVAGNYAVPSKSASLGANGYLVNGPEHSYTYIWVVPVVVIVAEASSFFYFFLAKLANGDFDAAALVLLLAKSWSTFRGNHKVESLLTVITKDGITYFVCVLALSIGSLIAIINSVPLYKLTFFMQVILRI